MKPKWKTLSSFLNLQITPSEGSASARRQPLGYLQITPTGTAAVIPLASLVAITARNPGYGIGYAVIQCIGAASTDYAAWRDDGTAPTPTVSMRLFSTQELDYTGDIYSISFIIGSGSPVLNISLYGP